MNSSRKLRLSNIYSLTFLNRRLLITGTIGNIWGFGVHQGVFSRSGPHDPTASQGNWDSGDDTRLSSHWSKDGRLTNEIRGCPLIGQKRYGRLANESRGRM